METKQPALLTTGSPAKRIIFFAIPLLAGDFLHTFYMMADAFIVGRWLGINGLASVGAGASLIQFIFSFVIGMTAGFVVITTQRVGEGNEEGIRRSVAAGLMLCVLLTILIMSVLLPLIPHILTAMRTPAEIINYSAAYVTITTSGIAIFIFYFMVSGFIHAGGNSFTPFLFMIIANFCNIALDILFIVVFSWGIRGIAAATLISETIAFTLCATYLFRHYRHFLPKKQDWRSGWSEAGLHLSLGIAMALQRSIVEVGNLLVQAAMNTLGAMTIAAVSAAQRIRGLNMLPAFSISRAVTTFTAQNYGAKKMDRVYKGLFQACIISIGIGIFMAVLNQFTGRPIVSLFLRDSPEAIALAHQYILFTGYTVFILGIMLVFRSALQGLGMKTAPILCGVMETVMSILAAFILIPRLGFISVCLVNPLSWFASGIPLYSAFASLKKKLDKGMNI